MLSQPHGVGIALYATSPVRPTPTASVGRESKRKFVTRFVCMARPWLMLMFAGGQKHLRHGGEGYAAFLIALHALRGHGAHSNPSGLYQTPPILVLVLAKPGTGCFWFPLRSLGQIMGLLSPIRHALHPVNSGACKIHLRLSN